ncbi:hypothetical protein QUB69_06500 [Microcoleus sp. AT13-A6]|uniref:hypothetical protein n=1 Tax=Microcoleus sp. AT13-A6 TaxID=2818591 RepID=UPI002FD05DA2
MRLSASELWYPIGQAKDPLIFLDHSEIGSDRPYLPQSTSALIFPKYDRPYFPKVRSPFAFPHQTN